MPTSTCDILILSNGPGEVTTWVRPVVKALRDKLGTDPAQVRISLVLSPCPNATGNEVAIAHRYPEIDRVQGASEFFPFLLFGKTADQWDWHDRGLVLFLGGDQIYPVIIGKRLGYRTLVYAEWDARWLRWVDQFAVMTPAVQQKSAPKFTDKLTVVGDLMAEAGATQATSIGSIRQVGLLPGSKPAKLAQGVPLMLAIARHLHPQDPTLRFVIPVAPTLDLATLAHFADPAQNAIAHYFGSPSATLVNRDGETPHLLTPEGIRIILHTEFPAYDLLSQCQICLTTVGANTAELGSLSVPMLVLLPTQQLDAMRAWDGIPGLLANLPGIGTLFAKAINAQFLKNKRLLAWPNIWAGEEIVPELLGDLNPKAIAAQIWHYLEHPETLAEMRDRLRHVRGTPGAAQKIADLAQKLLAQ
ncbi:MAG: lipid-A-disaccharide synthase [Cyanobacteria bacterium J06638_22]